MAYVTAPTPIVALDVPTYDAAIGLVHTLGDACSFYKVGSELFTATGPRMVETLNALGKRIFLDLKFHDIPNTVRKAAESAASLGVSLITVHASGGEAMIKAAVDGAGHNCDVLAVTILTSLDTQTLAEAWDKPDVSIAREVDRLAALAQSANAAGVVCSGAEAPTLRQKFGPSFALLVPGIRLAGSSANDQSRTVTPFEAAQAGATYIILGRTVTQADNPVAAMEAVALELRGA
jgi:orotidine-5'-phosphate decarboxylase